MTLSAAVIQQFLSDEARTHIQVADCVTSTNSILKEQALLGAPEGTLLITTEQTAGRGRLGRNFHSPKGTGLYLSLLLRPTLPPEDAVLLTAAISVAATEAITELTGKEPKIKWVNDLYLDGKKIAGILTEASMDPTSGSLSYAVIGIGINLKEPTGGFPKDLAGIAGALYQNSERSTSPHTTNTPTRPQELPARLVAGILNHFYKYYDHLTERAFLASYRAHSCLIGQKILVKNLATDTEGRPATALDIDAECNLVVEYEDGTREALHSGDVTLHRASAYDGKNPESATSSPSASK